MTTKRMRSALSLLAWACLLVGLPFAESAQVDIGGSKDGLEDAASRESGNRLNEKDNTGLPIYTTLNGSVTNLNDILSSIKLNRTQAFLNCSQGSMQVELQFQEPFYGLAYADFDRNSACLTKGRGLDTARIELPLKGCGTIQDPPRVFTNNIVVRFHPFLEMDGDEVITIVCRYPPAIAELPFVPSAILPPTPEASTPLLSGFHVLLMICTLLFLTLLLAGLGCSYMCLRGRPVAIIRQTYTGSEITKLSGSSMLSHRSMFDDVFKIPRIMSTQQAYGSEAHLVIEQSDTLPSDYPSESHSEVDEDRSLPVSSAGSYETKALVHQQVEQRASSSLYSETINEVESTSIMASRITQSRHPMAVPLEPKFDVSMRVKQAPAAPSPMPSESEASIALERNLTTILEREESTRTIESPQPRLTSFAYAPELHAPPGGGSRQQTPPVYSRILRKQQAERETVVTESLERGVHTRPRSLASLDTEMTETRSLTEVTDASHAKYRVANMLAPPPSVQHQLHSSEQYREMSREQLEPLVEPIVSPRRPEITTHEVDDVFLRTVTEKKTIEDIERHRRQVTEYRARQQEQRQQQLPPDPKWDVTIRNYPTQEQQSPPDWENFSDISSASNLTLTNEPGAAKAQPDEPIDEHIQPTYTAPRSPPRGLVTEETEERSSSATWYNLERVLEPQYAAEFTENEKKKWRQIITTESTLRTLLTEAIVKEDYELIRKDSRYVNLFPPAKWDVIIRIISPPSAGSSVSSSSHGKSGQRYKRGKASEWDNRSRRSSLPTLYEYESDGGSSIRTFGQDHLRPTAGSGIPGSRIRKLSSTTRGGSEADLRSMSEMTVRDFARLERDHDQTSLSSFGEGESLVRSLSQPSLARSGSEFTEHWGLPARSLARDWDLDDDEDDEPLSSADTTPRAARRELVTSSSNAAATSSSETRHMQATSSFARYSERQVHRVQQQQQPRPGWFQDDSEPEMQI